MRIFNAKSQEIEEAEMTVDANNEIVATFKDGSIVKFPAGLSKAEFDKAIANHQEANEGQEIITPEMEAEAEAERRASLELIGETIQDEGDKTNVPSETPEG